MVINNSQLTIRLICKTQALKIKKFTYSTQYESYTVHTDVHLLLCINSLLTLDTHLTQHDTKNTSTNWTHGSTQMMNTREFLNITTMTPRCNIQPSGLTFHVVSIQEHLTPTMSSIGISLEHQNTTKKFLCPSTISEQVKPLCHTTGKIKTKHPTKKYGNSIGREDRDSNWSYKPQQIH